MQLQEIIFAGVVSGLFWAGLFQIHLLLKTRKYREYPEELDKYKTATAHTWIALLAPLMGLLPGGLTMIFVLPFFEVEDIGSEELLGSVIGCGLVLLSGMISMQAYEAGQKSAWREKG